MKFSDLEWEADNEFVVAKTPEGSHPRNTDDWRSEQFESAPLLKVIAMKHVIDPCDLAREFCQRVRAVLTPDQLAEIVHLNEDPDEDDHLNDHLDAESLLRESLIVFGVVWGPELSVLRDSARDIARDAEFDPNQCHAVDPTTPPPADRKKGSP